MTHSRESTRRNTRRQRKQTGAAMSLAGHLYELRTRLIVSTAFIVAGGVVGWIYYNQIFNLLADPYLAAVAARGADGEAALLVLEGIAAPLIFQLQIASVAGVVLASPVWLYEIWAFITPALMKNEKKWTVIFLGTAVPLFFAGAGLAYWVLPKAITILLNFTPENIVNYNNVSDYLSFILRMLLVFGLAFELPIFVILLNFAGVVTGVRLSSWRRWIIFLIFVFAAVGTPTGDPITMLSLAIPMWVLFEIAVVICRIHDRRKGGEPSYDQWADDEASPI